MADEKAIEEDTLIDVVEDPLEVEGMETPKDGKEDSFNGVQGGSSKDIVEVVETNSLILAVNSEYAQQNQTNTKSVQNGNLPHEDLEEISKSNKNIGSLQKLPLNGKKSSLDKLNQAQKPRPSRLHRQCQHRFREIIGKREMKNEELEKQQGDLAQRLNILECSMPAVMMWNIWRMSQGACIPNLHRVLEKQFQEPASGEVYCPSTPSRHFDCRIREIESERKQAQKKVEEARTLWSEKMTALEEREKRLEEAKKCQEERKQRIEQLTAQAQKLREEKNTAEDDGTCESGECGVIECKKKWLEKMRSNTSIKSTDIECLEKLQQLAETELNMKRQIAELERREEAYMKTLQQADELWCKVEGDAASTLSVLQEHLDMKTAANQQMADRICQLEDELEKLRAKMTLCRSELEKFLSVDKIEALTGRDDDFADVTDEATAAKVLLKHSLIGRDGDLADVTEEGTAVKVLLKHSLTGRDDDLADVTEEGTAVKVLLKHSLTGRDDDLADVTDEATAAKVLLKHSLIGRDGDLADVDEKGVLSKDEMVEKGVSIKEKVVDKDMLAQLNMKVAANQQMADRICQLEDELENLRAKMASCTSELEKFLSIDKIEALTGRDDDFADVTDEATAIKILHKHSLIGRDGDLAAVDEKGVLIKKNIVDNDMLARPDVNEAGFDIRPDVNEAGFDIRPDVNEAGFDIRPDVNEAGFDIRPDVNEAGFDIQPENFEFENRRLTDAAAYLTQLDSLSALDRDGDICPPDFDCNDLVLTETGLTEEELTTLKENRITAQELINRDIARKEAAMKEKIRTEQIGYEKIAGVEETKDSHEGADEDVNAEDIVETVPTIEVREEEKEVEVAIQPEAKALVIEEEPPIEKVEEKVEKSKRPIMQEVEIVSERKDDVILETTRKPSEVEVPPKVKSDISQDYKKEIPVQVIDKEKPELEEEPEKVKLLPVEKVEVEVLPIKVEKKIEEEAEKIEDGRVIDVPLEIPVTKVEEILFPCVCEERPSISSETLSVKMDNASFPCVCEDAPKVSSETHSPVEKDIYVYEGSHPKIASEAPSVKMRKIQSPAPAKTLNEIEVTQIETTQMEVPKATMQVITQTVSDIGTQTHPTQRMIKRNHHRTIDPGAEILEQLTRWKKASKESSMITTATFGSQTVKSNVLGILQSLKSSAPYAKYEHEQELRTIQYGKKSVETKALCNCCMCGKLVPSTLLPQRSPAETQNLSATKPESPQIDQTLQHETVCPVCKIKKLHMSLRSQDSPQQIAKRPMRDQEVSCCGYSMRRTFPQTYMQKSDQSCMVGITKIKTQRTKMDSMAKIVNVEMDTQKMIEVPQEKDTEELKMEDKKGDKIEGKTSIDDCLCSITMEIEPGVVKKFHCACGDPD